MENAMKNENTPAKTARKRKRKHPFPFSKPLFFESLKANWKNVLGVGLANSVLIIVIVSILATLNVNATSDALRNLFDSASTETSVKSGAVSYYQAYQGIAEGYETLNSSLLSLESATSSALNQVGSADTERSFLTLRTLYNATYRLTQGDEASKKQAAYNAAYAAGVAALDMGSQSQEEKEVAKKLIAEYLTLFSVDTSRSHKDIMIEAMPRVAALAISEKLSLSDSDRQAAYQIFVKAVDSVYPSDGSTPSSVEKASYEAAFSLGEIAAKYAASEDDAKVFGELKAIYLTDPDSYVSNASYRLEKISGVISDTFYRTAEESAYYAYLPSFEVSYNTSDLGWPLTYVPTGKTDENGDPIVEEVEVKSYRPDLFKEKEGGLGTPATFIEKMRKEALTGVPYSDTEITLAKQEAKEALEGIKPDISSFLDEYLTRDEKGENAYYHDGAVDLNALEDKAVDSLLVTASKTYLETYNKKYGTSYTELTAIPSNKGGMSGTYIRDTILAYADSGIATYSRIYKIKIADGYSQKDAMMIATSRSAAGVMDQLPTDVSGSLSEMGGMNLYATITGKVGFAISCLLIPMIYSVMLATSLVSQKVENGSLAFTFSTPVTRKQFVVTEGSFLILSELAMGSLLVLGSLAARGIGILMGSPDLSSSLSLSSIGYYALGNFMVTLAMSAISFLASCYFNKSGRSIGVSGGFVVLSFLATILGLFGSEVMPSTMRIDAMGFFNYITPISLFDALAVMDGEMGIYWIKLSGLLLISLLGYIGADIYFERKDLPL